MSISASDPTANIFLYGESQLARFSTTLKGIQFSRAPFFMFAPHPSFISYYPLLLHGFEKPQETESFEFGVSLVLQRSCGWKILALALMKMFAFWLLLLVVGTTFVFSAFSTILTNPSTPDMTSPIFVDSLTATASIKELKGKIHNPSTEKRKSNAGNIDLEDYHRIDPAPSSRACIKSGPIEHGTPLMPHIPKPSPQYPPKNHPKHGGPPLPS